MRFAVDTWAPEYGVAADAERLEEASVEVRLDVECAAGDWTVQTPDAGDACSGRVAFIDGVRRVDARVWISAEAGGGSLTHAAVCASVAAGAVVCDPSAARVEQICVSRRLFADAASGAVAIATRHGDYDFTPTAGSASEDLYRGIHDRMTALELQVADLGDTDMVIFDGPLRGRSDRSSVGFVKTQHVQYLPDAQQAVVSRLRAGQRTPLFWIPGPGTGRWSWYLRLPGPIAHGLSGVVRCELPGSGSAVEAVQRASSVTATLQRYASEPHKDARAPQNLYPIAGLENELRRRLGDRNVMERALRVAAASVRSPAIGASADPILGPAPTCRC